MARSTSYEFAEELEARIKRLQSLNLSQLFEEILNNDLEAIKRVKEEDLIDLSNITWDLLKYQGSHLFGAAYAKIYDLLHRSAAAMNTAVWDRKQKEEKLLETQSQKSESL